MCGILCCISKKDIKPIPSIHPLSGTDGKLFWESGDANYINDHFIKKDFVNVRLSDADKQKLDNLEEIRTLNEQLVKLKNNVKRDPRVEELKIKVQNRIDELGEVGTSDECIDRTPLFEFLLYKIASRGPDYLNYTQFKFSDYNVELFSSILSLRQPFTKQPNFIDDIVLQFNGELYNQECLEGNDTEFIINLLDKNIQTEKKRSDAILKTICQLDGEFAFVLIDLLNDKIYFGRDSIGKRSLLYSLDEGLTVSSLPPSYQHKSNTFIECKNEISTYTLQDHNLQHQSYGNLWIKFDLENSLQFHPKKVLSNLSDNAVQLKVEELYKALNQSCLIRQDTIHPVHESDSLLGILFSGGLDCTVLASLICRNLRKTGGIIDLLTVGFDNPRANQTASESPDRKLSKKSWFHLSKLYNSETFTVRLVEVNVPYKDWLQHKERVKQLMYPNMTEMDLSIAIAFYFASKYEGKRLILKYSDVSFSEFETNEKIYLEIENDYKSNTKVLFSGLGADELFAGYSRHEAIFCNLKPESSEKDIIAAYDELSDSLIHDINVIHARNLGRDDRVISSWGKELRYPFLDNTFINYVVNEIEPNLKFHYTFELVTSKKNKSGKILMRPVRKYLLRELASYLELDWVKNELKRAIQFGAKSAKLEIGQSKAKGTDAL